MILAIMMMVRIVLFMMMLLIVMIVPCLTKPFILLLLLGYLCTIYTQINTTVQTKLPFSLQKFINLPRSDIPFSWLNGIAVVGVAPFSIYFLKVLELQDLGNSHSL